jgi:hypothetical protein
MNWYQGYGLTLLEAGLEYSTVPRADYFTHVRRSTPEASTGLKWPLIIDFSTVSGSLIVTGVPFGRIYIESQRGADKCCRIVVSDVFYLYLCLKFSCRRVAISQIKN